LGYFFLSSRAGEVDRKLKCGIFQYFSIRPSGCVTVEHDSPINAILVVLSLDNSPNI
jgi:hypothetical protein